MESKKGGTKSVEIGCACSEVVALGNKEREEGAESEKLDVYACRY